MEKPVIHGRDHTANGSDPIPGIGTGGGGGVDWADIGVITPATPLLRGSFSAPNQSITPPAGAALLALSWTPQTTSFFEITAAAPTVVTILKTGWYVFAGNVYCFPLPTGRSFTSRLLAGGVVQVSNATAPGFTDNTGFHLGGVNLSATADVTAGQTFQVNVTHNEAAAITFKGDFFITELAKVA